MTTTSSLKSGLIVVLDEFSKVIAKNSTVIPIFLTGLTMFNGFAIPLRKIVNFLVNDKGLSFNSARAGGPFVISFIFLFISIHSFGQERPIRPPGRPLPIKADTIPLVDSL